jgi:predicted PhzF superfamily epimerase YddE/YHI9
MNLSETAFLYPLESGQWSLRWFTSQLEADFCDHATHAGNGAGIDEDPVTGSAHCALAPWWGKRLNRRHLVGCQALFRGGMVGMDWQDDRVGLQGKAVVVMQGQLIWCFHICVETL